MASKAIFLDRDGVINHNKADYVRSVEQFTFLPGSLDALQRLTNTDWKVVVVTNQSGVGRGVMAQATLDQIHEHMLETIHAYGGRVDAVYACVHAPEDGCECRKPEPGMLLDAARQYNLALEDSYMIGDAKTDVQAALAAGCQPILVKTGRGIRQLELMSPELKAQCALADDLSAAVDDILLEETSITE